MEKTNMRWIYYRDKIFFNSSVLIKIRNYSFWISDIECVEKQTKW